MLISPNLVLFLELSVLHRFAHKARMQKYWGLISLYISEMLPSFFIEKILTKMLLMKSICHV